MRESRRYELGTEIPVHSVTVDVVVPLRSKGGRLLEEAKGRVTTMVPRTEGDEYVTLDGVVTYGGRRYGVPIPVPCAVPEGATVTVTHAPITVQPRERREVALERDADGEVRASFQEVY